MVLNYRKLTSEEFWKTRMMKNNLCISLICLCTFKDVQLKCAEEFQIVFLSNDFPRCILIADCVVVAL